MFQCEHRGILSTNGDAWTDKEAAHSIPGDTLQNLLAITELVRNHVARKNDSGAIYSKRMVEDDTERHQWRERTNRLRAKGGGDPDNWTAIRVPILKRDDYMCAYCGRYAETVDHVVPKSKNGTEDNSNLVSCCKRCNNKKSNRSLEEAGMKFWGGFDTSVLCHSSVTLGSRPSSSSSSSSNLKREEPISEQQEEWRKSVLAKIEAAERKSKAKTA